MTIKMFHKSLVLADWARRFFQGNDFSALCKRLNHSALEGVDPETGRTKFFEELLHGNLFNMNNVDEATFVHYDQNIVQHWKRITEKRTADGESVQMKGYQYLSLLVTELYLDWYFNKPNALKAELKKKIDEWNGQHPARADRITDIEDDELRKASFWMATGSGKTLLMHVNILQYLWYAKNAGKSPQRVVVLTPNEGLSRQHAKELGLSGFAALGSKKDLSITGGPGGVTGDGVVNVFVIDVCKVRSSKSTTKPGPKTVPARAFEGENLVLVDEGHHGSSKEDGEHRAARDEMCQDGFSFEYSATFGQAIAGNKPEAKKLRLLYSKNILFDYSYRYFYRDGYGKESFILNMPDDKDDEQVFRYLCANLLAFYQQRYLYEKNPNVMKQFGIANPLCVFVGHTVKGESKGKKKPDDDQVAVSSDVVKVIKFFADVLARRGDVETLFEDFVCDKNVLLKSGDRNPLQGRFKPLLASGMTGSEIYDAMLKNVFNTDHVESLKIQHEKSSGEITLSVADGRVFGLLNIGDAPGFLTLVSDLKDAKRLDNVVLETEKMIGGESRFAKIDDADSPISVLVGARKFTEGWSSWRVSAMGLLHFGQSEGTQVIQMFGRGVRLKGLGFSLKRSTRGDRQHYAKGVFLEYLETLQIFGLRANYMTTFRGYLEEEGVPTADSVLSFEFPICARFEKERKTLRVMQVRDGYRINQEKGFRTQDVTLFEIPKGLKDKIGKIQVEYSDFADLQYLATGKAQAAEVAPKAVTLDPKAFAFFDWDKIYRTLLHEKAQAGCWNLALDKKRLVDFGTSKGWYTLFAREEDVRFTDFAHLRHIEYLFVEMVKAYMERFYKTLQSAYEDMHSALVALPEDWIPDHYVAEIENPDSDEGQFWSERLKAISAHIASGDITEAYAKGLVLPEGFVLIAFQRHLYAPLVHVDREGDLPVTFRPSLLDAESEWNFVKDLEAFYNNPANKSWFDGIDLYLMRNNAHRLRGVGFAQAGNFHPDFLLWIVEKETGRQHLTFVDPKGLRNVSFDNPKVRFFEEVKNLEKQLNEKRTKDDPEVVLESAILSVTPSAELADFGHTKDEWEARHVFFMEDQGAGPGDATYLQKLMGVARGA